MAISSAGIGSGLDVTSIVNQLMQIEQQPLVDLAQKEAKLQTKLTSVAQLKGGVSTFETAVAALGDNSKFSVLSGNSTDPAKVGATIDPAKAVVGSYSIGVSVLAKAQKLSSSGFNNTTDPVGSGTMVIQLGSYDSTGKIFTANPDKGATTIAIDSSHNSLAGIRDAINKANAGVTATIVNDGSATNASHLVISSNDSGTKNSMRITVTDDDTTNTDNSGLSQLAFDPSKTAGTGKNLAENQGAVDAVLNIDGVTVTKSTNLITDAIEGVTLNVKDVTTTNLTVSVSKDTSGITSSLKKFVDAYNGFIAGMNSLGGYDATTKVAGSLQGEAVIRTIQSEVRQQLNSAVTGNGRTLTSLSDVGVEFQKDGTLMLDQSKLNSAIQNHFNDIPGLFGNFGVASDPNIQFNKSTSSTKSGTYQINLSAVPQKAYYNGTTPGGGFTFPVTVDATNNTFQILVDGSPSGAITLAQGSYATGDALAAELQSKINGDGSLKAASKSLKVNYNATSSRFEFTSNTYGSTSSIEFASVGSTTAATLGFNVGKGAAGTDVAGSIGALTGTGTAQTLTGVGMASGMNITVNGGTTGDRGVITYTQGIASRLDAVLNQMLASNGLIDAKTNSINKSVKDIGDQRTAINTRLTATQARYQAQFTQLDTLISSFKQTQAALTSQLASLPGIAA